MKEEEIKKVMPFWTPEFAENLEENLEMTENQIALLKFLEQERPIILNWEGLVVDGANTIIEIDPTQGYTTLQTTFNISDMDYLILEECLKGDDILFTFKGQNFHFEMGIDPEKIMSDHGKIKFFEMPLKQKPVILRFIQINND